MSEEREKLLCQVVQAAKELEDARDRFQVAIDAYKEARGRREDECAVEFGPEAA